jgi:hypothetical protein
LRFTDDEFLGNPQLVMDQVLEAIESTKSPPPSAGEGAARRAAGEGASPSPAPSPGSLRSPPSPAEGGG